MNGRFAAKVGREGPAGLLSVPCEEKRGRLEVEYGSTTRAVVQRDFTIEQPFPSDRPVTVEAAWGRSASPTRRRALPRDRVGSRRADRGARGGGGRARLRHPGRGRPRRVSRRDAQREQHALQPEEGIRGPPNPGHLLWFMGQGVWADADADAIGYIKIAERQEDLDPERRPREARADPRGMTARAPDRSGGFHFCHDFVSDCGTSLQPARQHDRCRTHAGWSTSLPRPDTHPAGRFAWLSSLTTFKNRNRSSA